MRPVLVVLLAALLGAALAAGASAAVIHTSDGVLVGVQRAAIRPAALPAITPASSGLIDHFGPVSHGSSSYALFWDGPQPGPTGQPRYPQESKLLIEQYLRDVAADSGGTMPFSIGPHYFVPNVNWLSTQYYDSSGNVPYQSTYAGTHTDTSTYPTSGCVDPQGHANYCLTAAQLQSYLTSALAPGSALPVTSSVQYFVMLPPGVVVCTDGSAGECSDGSGTNLVCSFHSFVTAAGVEVPYAVIPWLDPQGQSACEAGQVQQPNDTSASPVEGDMMIDQISAQTANIATDPQFTGWTDSSGLETSDLCSQIFPQPANTTGVNQIINGDRYWVQSEWSNGETSPGSSPFNADSMACLPGVRFLPRFIAPTPVKVGDNVAFDGSSSLDSLGIPTSGYHWDFGDGTTAVGPSPFHAFSTPGTFTVTLTTKDDGSNSGAIALPVTVTGPPPAPAPAAAANAAPGGAGTAPAPKPGVLAVAPPPRASLSTASPRLRRLIRRGLAVRYYVSAKVAGNVELLVDRSTAHRLHLPGTVAAVSSTASGPGAVVIARAVVVTERAGGAQMLVRLPARTAAALRRAHRLSLTVLLTVSDGLHRAVVAHGLSLH